ncbi:MAG: hypothetical protein QG636_354 [Patescibacteria group bacterium]|nr:hypothetical protein [Patescibacteria group bacterium]
MPPLNDPKKDPATTPTPAQTAANITVAPEDRSKYIRTMAKDMATLSGNPPVHAPTKKLPAKEETVAGVTLKTEERPFFEKPQSREEREADVPIALPSMQEASTVVEAAPNPVEVRAAERAAVLERLRQKVGESAQMSIQDSPAPEVPSPAQVPAEKSWPDIPVPDFSVPETPKSEWANIPAPAPQFAPLAEPVPSRLPPVGKESYREPIESSEPGRPLAPAGPDVMHTYSSDFSNRIDTKSASTFSVLAAEQDSQTKTAAVLSTPKKSPVKAIVAVGTGILLLALAGGGIFATYQFVMTMRDTPIASLTVPSIVFADEYRELSGTGNELMSAFKSAANGALVPGNVLVTYILTDSNGEDGSVLRGPAGGAAFVRALQVPAPDILLRNIAEESTTGVVNAEGNTTPFFALRVDSYERTYAGILTWEPLMHRDLGLLYPLYAVENAPAIEETIATTTATSTIATTTKAAPVSSIEASARTRFEDAIVANHDVRILRDTEGRSLILYGYADKRTLLIVRDEASFEALLARLKAE